MARSLVRFAVVMISALSGCGFTDKDKVVPPDAPDAPDASSDATADVPDIPDIQDMPMDKDCTASRFPDLERVSDLAPSGHTEADPAIAATESGELWLTWVDRTSKAAPGTLRVAIARESNPFGPSGTLAGCEAIGTPAIAAAGSLVVVAALCADLAGRVCAYAWDSTAAAWNGPVPVDDTGEGPGRSSLALTGEATSIRAGWVEDTVFRSSQSSNGVSWSVSEIVSEKSHQVVEGTLAGNDLTWAAYSFFEGKSATTQIALRRHSDTSWKTVSTTDEPGGATTPELAAAGDEAIVAYLAGDTAWLWRSLKGGETVLQEVGLADGAVRLAWNESLHGIFLRDNSLFWFFAADATSPTIALGEIAVPVSPTALGDVTAQGDTVDIVVPIATAGDIEVFRQAGDCPP